MAYKPFSYIEWVLAILLGANSLFHLMKYTLAVCSLRPVVISKKQRKLLGISDDDPLFKNEVPTTQKPCEPSTPMNFSCMNLSRHSNTLGTPNLNETSKFFYSKMFSTILF